MGSAVESVHISDFSSIANQEEQFPDEEMDGEWSLVKGGNEFEYDSSVGVLASDLHAFSNLIPSTAEHSNVYGSPESQFKIFNGLCADKNIDESAKALAKKQINHDVDSPLQIYRAIQTLRFARAKKLDEFQAAKKQLVKEFAISYLTLRSDCVDKLQANTKSLVDFAADYFGFNCATCDTPSFVKTARDGEISYQEAVIFLRLLNVYLSPAKLLSKLKDVDGAQKLLVWDCKSSSVLHTTQNYNGKRYTLRVLTWEPYALDINPEQLPQCQSSISSHISIPVYEAALQKCFDVKSVLFLATRIFSNLDPRSDESHQLLLILLRTKIRELKSESSNFNDQIGDYVSARNFSAAAIQVLSTVLEKEECTQLIKVLVQPSKLSSPESQKTNPKIALFFSTKPSQALHEKKRLSLLSQSIKFGNLSVVEQLLPETIDGMYHWLFYAVEMDRPEVVCHLIESLQLSITTMRPTKVKDSYYTKEEHNLFSYACSCKSYNVIKALMHQYDIDVRESCVKKTRELNLPSPPPPIINIFNPLQLALKEKDKKLVLLLLENFDEFERLKLISPELNSDMLLLNWACKTNTLYLIEALLPRRELLSEQDFSSLERGLKRSGKRYLQGLPNLQSKEKILEPPVTQNMHKPEEDRDKTLFYKKRHLEEAVVHWNKNELQRWMVAGVHLMDFGVNQVSMWIKSLLEKEQWLASYQLFSYLDAEEQNQVLSCKTILNWLLKSGGNIEKCRILFASEKFKLTAQQKHSVVFNLLKLSLLQNNSEKVGSVVMLKAELVSSEDMESLISTHLKTMALEGDDIQKFTVETTSYLLTLMSPEDQKTVLASPQFLLKVLLQENGTNIHPFICCLEQLKFDSSFTHNLYITMKKLIVEYGLAQPEAETQL